MLSLKVIKVHGVGERNTRVHTLSFAVKVGVHPGSALSPLLFIIIMDVLAEEVQKSVSDDVVPCAEGETQLQRDLND